MLPAVWLESALQDIARITAYIADSNPNAAYKHFRHGRLAGTHEFVSYPNNILVYRRSLIAVEILSAVHSRQEYP